MKAAQLAARQITDPALAAQIAELGDRLTRYVAPVTPFEQPKGARHARRRTPIETSVATAHPPTPCRSLRDKGDPP